MLKLTNDIEDRVVGRHSHDPKPQFRAWGIPPVSENLDGSYMPAKLAGLGVTVSGSKFIRFGLGCILIPRS